VQRAEALLHRPIALGTPVREQHRLRAQDAPGQGRGAGGIEPREQERRAGLEDARSDLARHQGLDQRRPHLAGIGMPGASGLAGGGARVGLPEVGQEGGEAAVPGQILPGHRELEARRAGGAGDREDGGGPEERHGLSSPGERHRSVLRVRWGRSGAGGAAGVAAASAGPGFNRLNRGRADPNRQFQFYW
jgi:hypothetical protein